MATIDDTGLTPTTLEQYLEIVRDAWRGVLGPDASFDPETPQEQVSGVLALAMSQADDVIARAYQALNITRSVGLELDGHGSALGILRLPESHSISEVVFNGVPGTIVPVGARQRTVLGDVFRVRVGNTIGALGTADGLFESVEVGPVPGDSGTASDFVDIIPGWESTTAIRQVSLGRFQETDAQYLRRYYLELFSNARGPLDAVRAEVSQVENLVEVFAAENDQDTPQIRDSVSLPPHSIAVIVDGGESIEIANAIFRTKTVGTTSVGTTSVDVITEDGFTLDIRFYRAESVEVDITVDTTALPGFAGAGAQQIEDQIRAWFAGNFVGGPGQFEIDGVRIGEDLYRDRLYTPINSVPLHRVSLLQVVIADTPTPLEIVPATLIQKIQPRNITVTVS